jgi:hypothetical protein
MIGWVKLHRKILDSNMYKSLNSKQRDVMIAVLLIVNFEENEWEWESEVFKCKPGQRVTSLKRIADLCGCDVKVQSVRTALLKLEKWGFLTNVSTKTGRLITVVNWDRYQSQDEVANKDANRQLTKDQQSSNKELTTIKERRELEERKEEYILSENSDHTQEQNGNERDRTPSHGDGNGILGAIPSGRAVLPERNSGEERSSTSGATINRSDELHYDLTEEGDDGRRGHEAAGGNGRRVCDMDGNLVEDSGGARTSKGLGGMPDRKTGEGGIGNAENVKSGGSPQEAGGRPGAKHRGAMEDAGQDSLEGNARIDSRGERKQGGQVNDNLETPASNQVKPAAKKKERKGKEILDLSIAGDDIKQSVLEEFIRYRREDKNDPVDTQRKLVIIVNAAKRCKQVYGYSPDHVLAYSQQAGANGWLVPRPDYLKNASLDFEAFLSEIGANVTTPSNRQQVIPFPTQQRPLNARQAYWKQCEEEEERLMREIAAEAREA